MGCAAALASLGLMDARFLEEVREKGRLLEEVLAPLWDHPNVADIRLRGLMGGIELVKDRTSGKAFPYELKMGYRVCAEARKQGVLLRPLGNLIVLMPPLAISRKDLARLAKVVVRSVGKVLPVRK